MLETYEPWSAETHSSRHELLSVSKAPPLKLVSAPQATFEVTTLDDVINASDGELSLREAIGTANASTGADTITFADKIQGGTIELVDNLPSIEEDLLIDGNTRSGVGDGGSDSITIDGNFRAYNAPGGGYTYSGAETVLVSGGLANLTLRNLTITGGKLGIENDGNDLALSDVVVTDNSQVVAFEGPGGVGIRNTDGGNLFLEHSSVTNNIGTESAGIVLENSYARLVNSTIADNQGSSYDYVGSGIKGFGDLRVYESTIANNGWANAVDITGNLALINSTVAGNSDGVFVSGTGEITNSTIADNGGSGVYALQIVNDSGAFFISNSIIAGEVYGSFISNGANIFTSNEPPIESAIPGDVLGADTRLLFQSGSLADNGGPTETIALLDSPTNPALDAADPADAPETDQRGLPRDATPDIGAFEVDGVPFNSGLVVTTQDDVILADGKVSLREAITTANITPGADTITFAEAIRGGTIELLSDLPTITDNLVIDGDPLDGGASGIVIDGNYGSGGASRGFNGLTADGVEVGFEDLTIQNTAYVGISATRSNTALERVDITGVGYQPTSARGVEGDGSLKIVDSVISGISVAEAGFGVLFSGDVGIERSTIENIGGYFATGMQVTGDVWIADSTFASISAPYSGEAVVVEGSLQIENSSFIGNGTENGFRVPNRVVGVDGELTIINSTFAGNASGLPNSSQPSDPHATIYLAPGSTGRIVNTTVTGTLNTFERPYGYSYTPGDSPIGTGLLVAPTSGLTISNSIIDDSIVGSITSNGANTFRDASVDGAIAGDLLGIRAESIFANVQLIGGTDTSAGRPGENGGPTPTIALLDDPTNPALNGADPADAPATDQRGLPRDATPDIGSFELEVQPPPNTLPPLAEKVPLPGSEIYGAPLFLVGPSGDAEVSFVDEYAAFQSSLGVYLVGPDGTIGATEWVFDRIEHSEASDEASANARPGGGPLSPGDAVLLERPLRARGADAWDRVRPLPRGRWVGAQRCGDLHRRPSRVPLERRSRFGDRHDAGAGLHRRQRP